jgi:Protein of unknown function (DUF3631)
LTTDNIGVVGSDLLDRVSAFVQRFVSLSESQVAVIALWIAHTHALDASYSTPYLSITSAEKQCGKTRLLEVLSLLVIKPWLTGSVSKAALVRKIDSEKPTLLLDESDAAFGRDKEYSEALRAVLNSGHSRDGVASMCVPHGPNFEFRDFRVFCPKAIAGIGKLPDTIADRAIPIRMKRRTSGERIERFRPRLVKAEGDQILGQLTAWVSETRSRLQDAKPALPTCLSDRQQDGCEPLLAIADAAGGHWPQKAGDALVEILTGEAAEDQSTGVWLLSDIRVIFDQQQVGTSGTHDLLSSLCDSNPLWSEFSHGKPISPTTLARLLRPYGIHHRKLRVGAGTFWGYERSSFRDAWSRYLPRNLEQVEQLSKDEGETQFQGMEHRANVPALSIREPQAMTRVVPVVPSCDVDAKNGTRYCRVHGTHLQWWERPTGSGDWLCGKCHPDPEKMPSGGRESRSNFHAPTAEEIGFD